VRLRRAFVGAQDDVNGVYIHPTAVVETDDIGTGTRIWAFSHVLSGATIGQDCNIGDHCFVETNVTIGNGVTIKNGNAIWEGVTLEDGVFVAPGVVFTNDAYPRSPRLSDARGRYADRRWLVPTTVRTGATIGAGAIIIAGAEIGEFAFVAAGALVTHDVAPQGLALGRPARVAGWVCRCGQKLHFENGVATCRACGLAFREENGSVSAS
jgi:UDP-2-acetamido-3-amino-2,3-dideoxy-glucuronate N-acetyltransferase